MKCKKKKKERNLCEILLLLFQVGHRGHIFSTFFLLMLDPDILKVWLYMFHKYLRYT